MTEIDPRLVDRDLEALAADDARVRGVAIEKLRRAGASMAAIGRRDGKIRDEQLCRTLSYQFVWRDYLAEFNRVLDRFLRAAPGNILEWGAGYTTLELLGNSTRTGAGCSSQLMTTKSTFARC